MKSPQRASYVTSVRLYYGIDQFKMHGGGGGGGGVLWEVFTSHRDFISFDKLNRHFLQYDINFRTAKLFLR